MGQAKLRKLNNAQVKEIVFDRLLGSVGNFQIAEVLDQHQKKEWMSRYKSHYSGHLKNVNDPNLYGANVRFIKAIHDGSDAGFVRLNDKTSHFSSFGEDSTWNITDGFTDSRFRGNGVLKRLIQFSVTNLNVKMFYMDKKRYLDNIAYYKDLGFTSFTHSSDGLMVWGLQTELAKHVPNSYLAT
jgi:hypothetical protein